VLNEAGILIQIAEMIKLTANTDGTILSSSYALEGPVLGAWTEFKKPYPVGIQVAPFGWEKGTVVRDYEIRGFLDKNEKNTVFCISFGFVAPASSLFILDSKKTGWVLMERLDHMFPPSPPHNTSPPSSPPSKNSSSHSFLCLADKWSKTMSLLTPSPVLTNPAPA